MDASSLPRIVRRKVEATMLSHVYEEARRRFGDKQALDLIAAAARSEALAAGAEFARQAPHGPSLGHFAGIIDRWREENALDIALAEVQGNRFLVVVSRCGYMRAYKEMGLPPDFAHAVSCVRDQAFAEGYSPRLSLIRSRTICEGGSSCVFTFSWK